MAQSAMRTPWSDTITLIWIEAAQDLDGYEILIDHPDEQPMYCNFQKGVSQSEYYASLKAGIAAEAQAEVQSCDYEAFWPEDYRLIRLCEIDGVRYRILRSFPQSFDTLTLMLAEVVR